MGRPKWRDPVGGVPMALRAAEGRWQDWWPRSNTPWSSPSALTPKASHPVGCGTPCSAA